MLTFESFDLEAHSSCKYDFVQISFGSVEQKYCGSNKPTPIISSGNTMTVLFHTDGSVNGNGFKATWKAVKTSGIKIRGLVDGWVGGWWLTCQLIFSCKLHDLLSINRKDQVSKLS